MKKNSTEKEIESLAGFWLDDPAERNLDGSPPMALLFFGSIDDVAGSLLVRLDQVFDKNGAPFLNEDGTRVSRFRVNGYVLLEDRLITDIVARDDGDQEQGQNGDSDDGEMVGIPWYIDDRSRFRIGVTGMWLPLINISLAELRDAGFDPAVIDAILKAAEADDQPFIDRLPQAMIERFREISSKPIPSAMPE